MTKAAQEVMVEYYKDLRADDAQGVGRNSYRITVRQLESMIRLSEAIARANCVNEITPAFVKEAHNLLQQSIIHVEKDDVEMDEEEEEEAPQEPAEEHEPVLPKEKTKVQYDKYIKMMNLIVRRLDEDDRAGGQGVEKDELIMWYLEQVESEDEMATEERVNEETQLVRKVLKRLKKVLCRFTFSNYRIITSWRFEEKQIWKKKCKLMDHGRFTTYYIQIVILKHLVLGQERKRKSLIHEYKLFAFILVIGVK
jgi:DNA replicative helicase MCM subunit Mcm2 (Cdc46/Mcm family)